MNSSEGWLKLKRLRSMVTEKTGMLHEAQIVQLKHWPLVAYPGAKYTVEIDRPAYTIRFRFETDPEKVYPDDIPQRFKMLQYSVVSMLGDEWMVEIFVDGNEVEVERYGPEPRREPASSDGSVDGEGENSPQGLRREGRVPPSNLVAGSTFFTVPQR